MEEEALQIAFRHYIRADKSHMRCIRWHGILRGCNEKWKICLWRTEESSDKKQRKPNCRWIDAGAWIESLWSSKYIRKPKYLATAFHRLGLNLIRPKHSLYECTRQNHSLVSPVYDASERKPERMQYIDDIFRSDSRAPAYHEQFFVFGRRVCN